MRWRFWLPVLQTTAMLLILWSPWTPKAHDLHVVFTNGTEIRTWTLIPGPNALEWAEGMNLPAAAIVTPAEFAIRSGKLWHSSTVVFFGLWLVGLLCWYMVGRFADDLFRWRRIRALPPSHLGDLIFALIAVPSAALLAIAFIFGDAGAPVIAGWGVAWVVVTLAALAFRTRQAIRQWHRPPVS